jgi:hypothetical protein
MTIAIVVLLTAAFLFVLYLNRSAGKNSDPQAPQPPKTPKP